MFHKFFGYKFKIRTYIISVMLSGVLIAGNSSAISNNQLNVRIQTESNIQSSIINHDDDLVKIRSQLPHTYTSVPGIISPLSLQGDTYVLPKITSERSPLLGGYIPSYCYGVGVVIYTDTANFDTGHGIYAYTTTNGQVQQEDGYRNDYRVWSLDLAYVGLGLINGKYNVYVSSPCDDDNAGNNNLGRDYSNPLFADIFYSTLSIIPTSCNESCTPVYRFYNTQNGAHFYTSNEDEKRNVIDTMHTYTYEGIVNFAKINQEEALIPVHRFYNLKTGTHFYTASQSEATRINNTMTATYRYEGVSYYSNSGPAASTTPVHRFYKFNQGVHFFTSNQTEASLVNNTMSNAYRYEGVSYYNIENN